MKLEYLKDQELIRIAEATPTELRGIKAYLDRYVEGYMFDPVYKNKLWNGKRTSYNKETNTFPLGLWKEAFKCCEEFGYPFNFINKQDFPLNRDIKKKDFEEFIKDFFGGYKFQPRDYQIRVAYNILKNRYCNIAVATSGGKTLIYSLVMFYLMSKYPDKKFLLVVPSKTLVTQFYDDVQGFNWNNQLDINSQEIFGKEEKPRTFDPSKESNFVIATFQSLTHDNIVLDRNGKEKKVPSYKKEWFQQFWSITGDEFHKGKSESYSKKIFKYTHNNAYYRWGMSGSYPLESTHEMAEIMKNTGPIVDTVKAKELMDLGFITKVKIKCVLMHHNDFDFAEALETVASKDKKVAYDLECAKIQDSKERLGVINQIVSKCKANTLVLFHNTEYGEIMFKYLKERNPEMGFHYIDGSVSNRNRTPIKLAMEQTKKSVEYTILNFGTYEVEVKSDFNILLSNGEYKLAADITNDDDIDDLFLETLNKI